MAVTVTGAGPGAATGVTVIMIMMMAPLPPDCHGHESPVTGSRVTVASDGGAGLGRRVTVTGSDSNRASDSRPAPGPSR